MYALLMLLIQITTSNTKLTSSRFKVTAAPLGATPVQVMPDDHSKSVPPLPIPNRTVKRLCADDSAATSVKVGYRQASYKKKTPAEMVGVFFRLSLCWRQSSSVAAADPSLPRVPG